MEVVRRQHRGQHGHIALHLHLHERADHGIGDEVVAIDAAVHHEGGADDGGVAAAARQVAGEQRDLEGTGRLEDLVVPGRRFPRHGPLERSEEHTSELQSLMRISYAVFCLKKKHNTLKQTIQIKYNTPVTYNYSTF